MGWSGWPDGHAAYAAGLGFHEYLVERFGQESLGRVARSTSRRLPFLGTPAYKSVLGESLGSLWRDYEQRLRDESTSSAKPAGARAATVDAPGQRGGRTAIRRNLRVKPALARSCTRRGRLHAFPSLRAVSLDGESDRELATRFMGSTIGRSAALLLFDQQEIRRDVGQYSDLYLFDRRSGRTRPLTREARLQDPDLAPDGHSIAAVRENGGRRDLVVVPLLGGSGAADALALGDIRTIAGSVDTQFSAPRWSPDGRLIAVERRQPGVLPDVVIIDPSDGGVRSTIADAHARIVTPAWSGDGESLIAAADFDGEPFDLYQFSLSMPSAALRLTRTSGALWPDVAPDGRTLVFAGYGVEGYDVYTLPYAALGEPPRPLSAPGTSVPR